MQVASQHKNLVESKLIEKSGYSNIWPTLCLCLCLIHLYSPESQKCAPEALNTFKSYN